MNSCESDYDQPYDERTGPALMAMKFLDQAKFAPENHLQLAAGESDLGFLSLLKEKRYVVGWRGKTVLFFTLSKLGAGLVGGEPFDLSKADPSGVRRALMAQSETLALRESHGIETYTFKVPKSPGTIGPSAQWMCTDGRTFDVWVLVERGNTHGDTDRLFRRMIGRPTILVFPTPEVLRHFFSRACEYAKEGIPDWGSIGDIWIPRERRIPVPEHVWDQVYLKVLREPRLRSLRDWGVKEGRAAL